LPMSTFKDDVAKMTFTLPDTELQLKDLLLNTEKVAVHRAVLAAQSAHFSSLPAIVNRQFRIDIALPFTTRAFNNIVTFLFTGQLAFLPVDALLLYLAGDVYRLTVWDTIAAHLHKRLSSLSQAEVKELEPIFSSLDQAVITKLQRSQYSHLLPPPPPAPVATIAAPPVEQASRAKDFSALSPEQLRLEAAIASSPLVRKLILQVDQLSRRVAQLEDENSRYRRGNGASNESSAAEMAAFAALAEASVTDSTEFY